MSNLMRYSPFSPIASLQSEVDRLFNRYNEQGEARSSSIWSPNVDLVEKEDAYLVHMDLPGLTREDVDITYEAGKLQISGERSFESDEQSKPQFHRVERWYGRFFRSFDLGREVEPENIKANFADGVLTIELPKTEDSRPMKIEIK